MKLQISEPQTRMLAFLGALSLILAGSVVGYAINGWTFALLLVTVLLVGIFILRPVLSPPWSEDPRGRLLTLTIFAGIAASFGLWDSTLFALISGIFAKLSIPVPIQPTTEQQIVVLAIVGGVLVILTWLFERNQILPPPQPQVSEEDESFPKTDYKELRDRFCKYMVTVLNKIDEEVNWSDSEFTTLEAEIVMEQRESSRPKIVPDLIEAIRKDHKTSTFILIGDPGSGKSVSLRRLARVLYDSVSMTGIVPVYVNLREWDGPREPTDSDIVDFVYRYLLRISGRAGQAFLKNWYEKMLSHGLFFFLIDSFDEMPAVMDCDERSPQLKKISEAFDRFFHDIHQCRGVLSSRPFRQPIGVRGRRLTIRPFTEAQIRNAMKNWLRGWNLDENAIIYRLFTERPELSPAIRNPFTADLIAQYVIDNPDKLPDNYFDLYDHYICKRLKEDISNLNQLGLTSDQVLDAATKIAWTMYNAEDVGLEIDVPRLEQLIADKHLGNKITAMRFSRIARVGGVDNERFSFAHRRFAEFFAVRAIQSGDAKIAINAIPSDSRWRDALVVYSGIAPIKQVEELATFSWQIIQKHAGALISGNLMEAMPAIHCLRFLRDACQSRSESLDTFRSDLSDFILTTIQSEDVLVAKIATEAVPLLTPTHRTQAIAKAFERHMPWLSETALRSCRHLANLEPDAIASVRQFIQTLPTQRLLTSFRDIDFSLSLSESLRYVRFSLRIDVISLVLLWILLPLFCVSSNQVSLLLQIIVVSAIVEIASSLLAPVGFWPASITTRSGFDSSIRLGIMVLVAYPMLLFLLTLLYSVYILIQGLVQNSLTFEQLAALPVVLASTIPIPPGPVAIPLTVLAMPWGFWPRAIAIIGRAKRFLNIGRAKQFLYWLIRNRNEFTSSLLIFTQLLCFDR